MSSESEHLREFGKFRLDAVKKILWFEEKLVNLALKEIELLCALTENGGELVTKNELMNKVWADSFVEESNLSRHIYILRKTFRDFGAENFIQTVPGRGYRFAGEVLQIKNGSSQLVIERHAVLRTLIEIQEEEKERSGDRKNALSGIFLSPFLPLSVSAILLVGLLVGFAFWNYNKTVAVLDIKSIAVLPFQTIDGVKSNEHQGVGLADVLITRLSNIKEINVRPTSAILNFDNQDSIAFGKKLNVDAVLEGTIYRTNDKIRVTAQLIKVGDNSPVWAGQFEKPLQDELRLQDEIALQLVDALALNLSGGEKTALTKRYTENANAYQLFIKGRYEWNKRSFASMNEAQRLFRNTIERDPNFALAHVGLADTLAMTVDGNQASIAVQKALELDPNLAEAHASLGFIKMFHDWNWQAAETAFKKSIELNPNYATAHQWYATLLAIEGRNEEAKAALRHALEINPLSHNFYADLGQIYYFNREYGEAEKWCLKALEIYPDFQFSHGYLYEIYLKKGDYDKAAEQFIIADKINHTFANESANRQEQLEVNYKKLRKIYVEDGIENFVEDLILKSQDANASYADAMHYAFLDKKEKALDSLEKAYESKGFLAVFVKADPIFDNLRDEPRYQEILRKMNL